MIRPHRRLLLAIGIAAVLATPIAAQELSGAYSFLKAVRDRDGAKAEPYILNPSSNAINARDENNGEGALHIVSKRRDIEWLAYLLGHGARPNLQTSDGTTALAISAQIGWIEGAQQLIARGANVDLANSRGETPLILAVQAREAAMARLLVEQGADPNRQDSFAGYSAIEYARRDTRNPELLRTLQETRPVVRRNAIVGPTRQ